MIDLTSPSLSSLADNAIPIRSWFSDPHDTALLCLLPVLDALRFVKDVRSVLSRNLHRDVVQQGPHPGLFSTGTSFSGVGAGGSPLMM